MLISAYFLVCLELCRSNGAMHFSVRSIRCAPFYFTEKEGIIVKKRWMLAALFLCFCTVTVMMLPVQAEGELVAEGTCGDNLSWVLDNEGTLTVSGVGDMPRYSNERDVPWWPYRDQITTAIIEDGVTSICSYAFSGFDNLSAIRIADTVSAIGDFAFFFCISLKEVVIPDTVSSLGASVFSHCTGLTQVTIGNGITTISERAFDGCDNLKKVKMSDAVTKIGHKAFSDCKQLSNVKLPSSLTVLEDDAFSLCSSFTEITIPQGVTHIGRNAFYQCNQVTSLTLPDTLVSIGDFAFMGCNRLQSIYISDLDAWWKLVTSSNEGIQEKNILYVNRLDKTLYLNGKPIVDLILQEGMTSIAPYAFYSLTIESVTIPATVTSIGKGAFMYCRQLKSVLIPDRVTVIGEEAFRCCEQLTDVTLGASVESLGMVAFSECTKLRQITIPDSVILMGESVFADCPALLSVTIGSGLTEISRGAFKNCSGLSEISIPQNISIIGESAFENCVGLTKVNFEEGLCTIERYAFLKCTGIQHLAFPDSVSAIGQQAFYQCINLQSIIFGDGLHVIEDSVFRGCKRLTDVVFSDNLKTISSRAFYECSNFEILILPESLEFIGTNAFYGIWHVLYKGSEAQWNAIQVDLYGIKVSKNQLHFNCTGDELTYKIMKAPTCTDDGRFTITCAICSKLREKLPSAKGHHWQQANCSTPKKCAYCGATEGKTQQGSQNHLYGPWHWMEKATCTQAGSMSRECQYCGKQEKRSMEALGHLYLATVCDPTCVEQGYTTYSCHDCADSYYADYLPSAGHAEEIIPGTQADCEQAGLTDGKKCSICGEVLQPQELIPATGHEWKAATCVDVKTCVVCKKIEGEPLPHNYGEWVEIIAPSIDKSGMQERKCADCDSKEQQEMAKLEVAPTEPENSDPTFSTKPDTQMPTTAPTDEQTHNDGKNAVVIVIVVAIVVVAAGATVLFVLKKKKQ